MERTIMIEKVKSTTFSLITLKTLGLDGSPPIFCHKEWEIIGKDAFWSAKEFFSSSDILKEMNNSFIFLLQALVDI